MSRVAPGDMFVWTGSHDCFYLSVLTIVSVDGSTIHTLATKFDGSTHWYSDTIWDAVCAAGWKKVSL